MRQLLIIASLASFALLACGSEGGSTFDPTLVEGLRLDEVAPATLLPRSLVVVSGESFVGPEWGAMKLALRGEVGNARVELELPLAFVDERHLQVTWPGGRAAGLPLDTGSFSGEARLVVIARADGSRHESAPLPLELDFAAQLAPTASSVQGEDAFTAYAWDRFTVHGSGLLLGGEEGQTVAIIEGCFAAAGGACLAIDPVEVPTTRGFAQDRSEAVFQLLPEVVGLSAGNFTGTVTLENRGADFTTDSAPLTLDIDVLPPAVTGFNPARASLGQIVTLGGGGMAPLSASSFTNLILNGTFTPASGDAVSLDAILPIDGNGRATHYIINEDQSDMLTAVVDPRHQSGTFSGTAQIQVKWHELEITSEPVAVSLEIAPLEQIVYVRFLPGYVDSLRYFGLRAVDRQIRERLLAVAAEVYQGVGVEFRTEEPTDFALYSTVDLVGADPGGTDLFGYDNTPGKDVENLRLADHIGGVNAVTQEDGSRGYGGIFVESLFGFSLHPHGLARTMPLADPTFDALFDPFRPDLGNAPVSLAEIQGGVITLSDASSCPAHDRPGQIACAVLVLGNIIGGTMAHEVGHSLGLANPQDPDVSSAHDFGDAPNRLMDTGAARSFNERAVMYGEGPGVFCDSEFTYLRTLMPSTAPPPSIVRPSCGP
jgi:hypothetical protein